MKITVRVKQAGRKRPLLENRELEIAEIGIRPTLGALIDAIVDHEVADYNRRRSSEDFTPALSAALIDRGAESGKIAFGAIYNESNADAAKAREAARLAFEDGLFSVFIGETEIAKIDDIIELGDSVVITFIRLTFLAGSIW